MSKFLTIFVACVVFIAAEALKLPDYIKPCSKTDPKFNECALQHGKEAIPTLIKGDPKYGVPVLDPMFVKEMYVKESGITIIASDFYVEGAKEAILKDVSVDFEKMTITLEVLLPLLVFRGKYDISGKIASLPISGKGDFDCAYDGLTVKYSATYNLTKKDDGKVYINPYDYDMDFVPKGAKFHFENLFNGNKLLGDTMNTFFNENWRLVLDEIGKPSYKALGLVVHEILRGVSQKVPYNELFSDSD